MFAKILIPPNSIQSFVKHESALKVNCNILMDSYTTEPQFIPLGFQTSVRAPESEVSPFVSEPQRTSEENKVKQKCDYSLSMGLCCCR